MIACVLLWAASVFWFGISLVRALFPKWRASGLRQMLLAAFLLVGTFVGAITFNQFIYLDYGLTSKDGLTEARAAYEQKQAEKAATRAQREAQEERSRAEAVKKQREAEKAEEIAGLCRDENTAFVMSQEFVRQTLKAPSTAEFPWITDPAVQVTIKSKCSFRVVGWVDAQNGFGAQVRSIYVVDLALDPEANKWQLKDISLTNP